jgi:LPXTG-motif cell wall-anchored protein
MTAELWMFVAAGLLIGGAAAWLRRRRRPDPAANERAAIDGLPTCEGLGPQRGPSATD